MNISWGQLFATSFKTPMQAAAVIVAENVPRTTLWLAVLAAAALNALIFSLSVMVFPLPAGWPNFAAQPLAYFVIVAGGLVLLAHVLTWVGRMLGGSGSLDDMLALLAWLQIIRVILQATGLILVLSMPLIAPVFTLVTGIWSLWMLIAFVTVGHNLTSPLQAVVVLFLSMVALVLGLSTLLALIGVGSLGVSAHV